MLDWATLEFQPLLPVRMILALGFALGLLAVVAYVRHAAVLGRSTAGVLSILRLAAITGLCLLLMRPMRPLPDRERQAKPQFHVLLDASGSMATQDMGGETRLAAVDKAIRKHHASTFVRLAESADIAVSSFSETTKRISLDALPTAPDDASVRTDLGQALGSIVGQAGERPQLGILLISDGRDNTGEGVEAVLRLLKTAGIPVWTACVGTPGDAPDVMATATLSQNFLFVNQPATLRATISHSAFEHRRVQINLYREDRYIATQPAVLGRGTTQVEFPISEERKGLFKYKITVDPLPGESDLRNNSRVLFARVVDEKTKVLVAEASPHWDSKFLVRALQADANLNVTSVFYLSPTKAFALREKTSAMTLEDEVATETIHLPASEAELFQYDCVLLGRDIHTLLTPEDIQLFEKYVSVRGGALVFFRGKAYQGESRLAGLEPVAWEDNVLENVQLELTPEGRMNPIFDLGESQPPEVILRSMPSLASITRVRKEKSLAVVLAVNRAANQSERMATLVYQRYGKGKVMSIGATGLWRWGFMAPGSGEYADVYEKFWRQAVQWLVFESDFLPGQEISFRTNSYTYRPGDPVRFTISTQQVDPAIYSPKLEIYPPVGDPVLLHPQSQPNHPSQFTAVHLPQEEGEYRAVLINNIGEPREDSVRFTVYSDLTERRLVGVDPELLTRISAVTGGERLDLDGLDKLPTKVAEFANATRKEERAIDAWSILKVFAALSGTLCLEWFFRKRWGVV